MNGSEGVIEPFLYLLFIWILRSQPLLAGLIAGVGISGRPFVLYGVVALLILESRASLLSLPKKLFKWGAGIAVSLSLIEMLARFSTNYMGLSNPYYLKPVRHMLEDFRGYFAEIIPQTIGLQVQRYRKPIPTAGFSSHFNLVGFALAGLGVFLLIVLCNWAWKNRKKIWETELRTPALQFPYYLTIIGVLSFGAYVVLSPPSDDIRYTYQLLFGFVGIYALQRKQVPSNRLAIWFAIGCFANNILANSVNLIDLRNLSHSHPTENLIQYLKEHSIRGGVGDYWASHNLTFLSNETIVIADKIGNGSRVPEEGQAVLKIPTQFRAQIRLEPCAGGIPVETWFVCPVSAPRR